MFEEHTETVEELIIAYELEQHIEGGFFRQVYVSPKMVEIPQADGSVLTLPDSTRIYFLLNSTDFSAFHRLALSEEKWVFQQSSEEDHSVLIIHEIKEDGTLISHWLGDPLKNSDAKKEIIIPKGSWFSAEIKCPDNTSFVLTICEVTPGFTDEQFELANREALIKAFPQHAALIGRLTRTDKEEKI